MPGSKDTQVRKRRLLLRSSNLCLLSLQVVLEVSSNCRRLCDVVGNPIKELANFGMLTSSDFFFGSDRAEAALIKHRDSIGNAKGARQFMGNDDDRHPEDLFTQHDKLLG